MVTLCSRGVNKLPLEYFNSQNIKLVTYDDSLNYVDNDVADCAMWHVMEGFRKFSLQQGFLRDTGHTIKARSLAKGDLDFSKGFSFGHELLFNNQKVESPMNKKVLVLGFGKIAQMLCVKLQQGLSMDVYYTTRSGESSVGLKNGFSYFPWESLKSGDASSSEKTKTLDMFECIVNCLPSTPETVHLIDNDFLSKCCPLQDLVFVNIGRGDVIDISCIADNHLKFRHLGLDVFSEEPAIKELPYLTAENSTITPHLGSSTDPCFVLACDYCISYLLEL